jgi:hypothetical protein
MFAFPAVVVAIVWLTGQIPLVLQCSLTWASRCGRDGLIAIQAA